MRQTGAAQKQLLSVQYLRGFAAMLVVFYHARNEKVWLFSPLPDLSVLTIGVDIFFVISGFIIFLIGRTERVPSFIRKRIIRVVPVYWVATGLAIILNPQLWTSPELTWINILRSLFFIPYYSTIYAGSIWPILIPGWSLNYEMFFYAVFTVGLIVSYPELVSVVVISSLVIVGIFFGASSAPVIVYTDPVMIEFMMGILLGGLFARGRVKNLWPLVPLSVGAAVVFSGTELPHVLKQGLPALLFVAGVLSLEERVRARPQRFLRILGDASYSIYLIHSPILYLCGFVFHRLPLHGWLQFISFMVVQIFLGTAAGIFFHIYVERTLIKFLGRRAAAKVVTHKENPADYAASDGVSTPAHGLPVVRTDSR